MHLILGNIEHMHTDAIATSAHTDLKPSPGISECIFKAADTKRLKMHCARAGRCHVGSVVVTPSCGLPSKYILHVVGPDWYSGQKSEQLLFAECYARALHKAYLYECKSVALPLMFSGEYHVPRAQALALVCKVVLAFERSHPDMDIYLVLYKQSIYEMARRIYAQQLEKAASSGFERTGK